MKTYKQFMEQDYTQNPGKYSHGYAIPIIKGVTRDVLSRSLDDPDKQKQINSPDYKKFLNQNKDKQIWRSFYPDNKKEYLNRQTHTFQSKPYVPTSALNSPKGVFPKG